MSIFVFNLQINVRYGKHGVSFGYCFMQCNLPCFTCMYLGQWGASLDPIKQGVLIEIHTTRSNITENCSGGGGSSSLGMAAVVVTIAHKHTPRFKEQSMLTCRAVLANGQLVCVWGGGGGMCKHFIFFLYVYDFCSQTGLFSPCNVM